MTSPLRREAEELFARMVVGYASTLDASGVRAWIEGHTNMFDEDGSWIACTRVAPALAAWLSQGRPDVVAWKGREADVRSLLQSILGRGCDPAMPGHWGLEGLEPRDQRTVESSVLAYAAWLARDTVIPTLSAQGRDQLEAWLAYFSSAEPATNNWALFWAVNHSSRKALGWSYDQAAIDGSLDVIDGLHRGDGWMTDGGEQRFDDYNWWVFGSHELMCAQLGGPASPARSEGLRSRVRERLADYPAFFAANGSYPEYGRSLAYTFARLGAPILAYQQGCWPHSTGLLARIVRRHLAQGAMYGSVDRETGIVRARLGPHGAPDVRERYIDTGHPYWAMLAFAGLWQLPDDDAIWTVEEDALPVERGDYVRSLTVPGWVLSGTQASGQVLRYTLASAEGGYAGTAAKYAKFCYGSHFPVDIGLAEGEAGPDAALCAEDEHAWVHCGAYEDPVVVDGWLRARHVLRLGDRTVPCETVLAVFGETWVTWHRVTLPTGGSPIRFVHGGSALGYEPGNPPIKERTETSSSLRYGDARSSIAIVSGWDRALTPSAFRGDDRRNGRAARSLTPTIEATVPADGSVVELVAVARTTRHAAAAPFPPDVDVVADADGTVEVRCADERRRATALVRRGR